MTQKNQVKKKKPKKKENKKESSDSSSEEEVKPKKTKVEKKKKESSDSESESEDIKQTIQKSKKEQEKKKEKDSSDEEEEEKAEPKLVKKEEDKDDEEEAEEEPKKQKQEPKKSYSSGTWNELFIKNLSYNTTQEGLADFFGKYGDVEETKIVYDKQSGRSKGVGFCRFYEAQSAVKAMEDAGNLTLDGRPISISYSNEKPAPKSQGANSFKPDTNFEGQRYGLFVGNLSFKSNEQGIENFFKDCGKIIDIRIAKDQTGRMRGFAHVDFDSEESVEKALKKNGFKLDGRELKLDKSESKPKAGGNKGRRSFNKGNKPQVNPLEKAKKTGAIISTQTKSIKIDSDDDDE